ncbi:MAG: hypothetical protein JJ858_04595 [Rhizobiaceae bacterium]|nr:hypothetical protein [Rhizobiaceae bacterium]
MSSPNGSDNHDKGKIAKLSLLRSEKVVFDLRHKAILLDIGVSELQIQHALSLAHQNETDVETELIANEILREEDYFRYVAKRLNLTFITSIPTFSILSSPSIDILLSRKGPLRIQYETG